MSGDKVDVGFADEISSWMLHPRFFPSKIGGKPAWLDLKNLPNPSDLTCTICNDPLIFLCQVYAPNEDTSIVTCFHRTIFIFICRNGPCCQTNSTGNLKVLRCQLPRKNAFYSFDPYEEKEEKFPIDKWCRLCYVCGMKAPSHCSKCKKIYYCSRKHQLLDWQNGHKVYCPHIQESGEADPKDFQVTQSGQVILFKEWDLDVEEEEEEDESDVDVEEEMKKLTKMMQEKKAGTLSTVSESELEEFNIQQKDKLFSKFSKRVSRHPKQVLRYEKGGTPLWITDSNKSSIMDIPKCQYCHGEREFEFQIMPQLLNHFDVGADLNGIDWGILAVFTCKSSCNEGPAYKEEFLIKQDFI